MTTSTTTTSASEQATLLREKHETFVRNLEKNSVDEVEFWATEHLRVSGVYWGLCALSLLHPGTPEHEAGLVQWVLSCFDERSGGFGGSPGHEAHILYTLSAIQVLALLGELGAVDSGRVAAFIASLQRSSPAGAFAGDAWGEIDTRFSYCAICCLSILGRLDAIDVAAAVAFIDSCRNFDGGYGSVPGAESHAGQVFCCVGALAIAGALGRVDSDRLAWWLAERQVFPGGGLNGRPEKLPDVCYSWWVLSSLAILGRLDWIDREALAGFILACQDPESGGFADRPGDVADVFHTFFGIAGLSLLGKCDVLKIDPAFALPVHVLEKNTKAKHHQ